MSDLPASRSDDFQQAQQLYREGRLDAALALCRSVLRQTPTHAGAHYIVGSVHLRTRKPAEAVAAFDEGLRHQTDAAGLWVGRGVALHALRRLPEALESFDRALAAEPGSHMALANRGAVLRDLDRLPESLTDLSQAITGNPGAVQVLASRAATLERMNRLEEALQDVDRALEIAPDLSDAWSHRGRLQRLLGRPGAGLQDIERALRSGRPPARTWINHAQTLMALGRNDEALASLDNALAEQPGSVDVQMRKAALLQTMKRPAEALDIYDRLLVGRAGFTAAQRGRTEALLALWQYGDALAAADELLQRQTDSVEDRILRARILREMGEMDQALADLKVAQAVAPASSAVWSALGALHSVNLRFDEGRAALEEAARLAPNERQVLMAAGLAQLLAGDYEQGWANYVQRHRGQRPRAAGGAHVPMWDGRAALDGRTILLLAEQGFGDTLQFCRFAPELAARGATILLWVQPELKSLLREMPGVTDALSPGDPVPHCDYRYPLLDLPYPLGTRLETIPAPLSYIPAPPDRADAWASRLPADGKPRIGLVWSGNPDHVSDRSRSLTLEALLPLLRLSDRAHFVSLQKSVRPADGTTLQAHPQISPLGEDLLDFRDTAGLLASLDLIISVDTSVAHLAGAVGRPVWVLVAARPSWRWLLGREDSPWYPSARLFRQPVAGDWGSVVAAVDQALEGWLGSFTTSAAAADGA